MRKSFAAGRSVHQDGSRHEKRLTRSLTAGRNAADQPPARQDKIGAARDLGLYFSTETSAARDYLQESGAGRKIDGNDRRRPR
jgi:hypothetical protein